MEDLIIQREVTMAAAESARFGLYTARSLPVVLALAECGLAIPTASPSAGTTVLLAAKAQTLSRQGCGQEALDTLDTLRSAFERLPDTVTGCTDSIYGWPERRLHHTASFVHAFTGSASQADRVHDKATDVLDHVPTTATSHAAVVHYRDQLATAGHRRSAGATGA